MLYLPIKFQLRNYKIIRMISFKLCTLLLWWTSKKISKPFYLNIELLDVNSQILTKYLQL